MPELAPRFNFRDVESKWCAYWEKNNCFHASVQPHKKSYSIVIPPPNITGILHMGHALNNTLQDIMARYKRMRGFETCWMPGTDHAGIATQNVVEKDLAKRGQTRHQIGREELLKKLWAWKAQYGDTIINQLKRLGSSCDWPRTRFTMDEGYSDAVKEVFVRLYEKGLIYQGQYIINWCPRCHTALADEEAEHREQQGALYHIRYPLKDDRNAFIIVATTRPETMLGDTAVAVHPSDTRYAHQIGKKIILPLMGREITIIADEFVDPAFGTGAVKVTPAHDPNDFQLGQRHKLEFINIMHPDGRLNERAGDFEGQDRFEAREAIIESLKEMKLLEKVEPHTHAVAHCYRCHTVIEPYLSKQWFVKMKPLAEKAISAAQEGKIHFYPERWMKVYLNWLENIRDWCISRQIWWGHRIPVWYCSQCPQPIVSRTTPEQCPHCGGKQLAQDEDVLDTWFSSWLWPFATFGWPRETPELRYFYPTNSLFTASEIIFFWIARMIMAGLEFMGDIPFSDINIHGTVRDTQGRKMSKSLGNAIDPLEIIEEYGADALRFSLIINSGLDLYISKEKFEIGRNFANKIWNASRLILMNIDLAAQTKPVPPKHLDLPSRWILSRFASTLANVTQAIEQFRFSEAENLIYDFFWKNFCDWYLEIAKPKLKDPDIGQVTFSILEQSLRMMHPFLPFVTEEIWQNLGINKNPVSLESWPALKEEGIDPQAESQMQTLIDIISQIRNVKADWGLKPGQQIDCFFASMNPEMLKLLQDNQALLISLLKIERISFDEKLAETRNSALGAVGEISFCLPLENIIDVVKEKTRISKEIAGLKQAMAGIKKRLENENFVRKAPQDVIIKDKERWDNLRAKSEGLENALKNLA